MFFNSVSLFVCVFDCVSCCYSSFVFLLGFFQYISPNTYVIEAEGFSDLSMTIVNLRKT